MAGYVLRNMLGILLGAFLCVSSFLPEIMYRALYSATWIDIHNQNGIGLYIYNFAESIIYISITYIECVLIGTIIISSPFSSLNICISSFRQFFIILLINPF